jgi:hypothetical protein
VTSSPKEGELSKFPNLLEGTEVGAGFGMNFKRPVNCGYLLSGELIQ